MRANAVNVVDVVDDDPGIDLGARRRARLAAARLYLICDSAPAARPLPEVLSAAIAGGVDIVQLREKRLDGDELVAAAREARELCARHGALFIVNDRPDVAVAVGADGVHVGQDDMPVARVRELVGPEMLVGLSTHTPAQIDAAGGSEMAAAGPERASTAVGNNSWPVDYIGVGPVYATPTKPGRPAVGLDLVRYAAVYATVPFFAIGGIYRGNVAAVLAAGAQRVAVVRAIVDSADPRGAARVLCALLTTMPTPLDRATPLD
jgi:thiamine-phosphate pyrophosphorylase